MLDGGRGVLHLGEARVAHLEDADLVGGAEAVLGAAQDAERVAALALDGEELEEAPAELLDALLAQVSARRRARRWRGIAVAAAAAIIAVGGGGLAGGILMSHHTPSQPTAQDNSYLVRGSDTATHVAAAVYYSASASGTRMQVQVTGIPDGTHCQFWVTTASGQHLWAGSWTVSGSHDGNWYDASTTAAMGQLRSFDISGAHGKILVSVAANS